MKLIIIVLSVLFATTKIFAQSSDSIVAMVLSNNLDLKLILKYNAADSVEAKTLRNLNNPEAEINYLFGSPTIIGNRTDVSFKQEFDFPTTYKYRNQISNIKNRKQNLVYLQKQKSLALETKIVCIDLIYCNSMIKETEKQLENALKIADSYKKKFNAGEANILEYNKAELNKLNVAKKLVFFKIEKEALLAKLAELNGNIPLNFSDTAFSDVEIPLDFEKWYSENQNQNPELKFWEQELQLSKVQEKLTFAGSLPKFSAGYMGEFTQGQNFQGVSFSLSVPLFENKNKLKYAKLKTDAVSEFHKNSEIKYYNKLNVLYNKALAMQRSLNEYKKYLKVYNNSDLLFKALEKGEIDLIDYILELSFYYESYSNLLEMERDLSKIVAELHQY